jgi:hypothetical protein
MLLLLEFYQRKQCSLEEGQSQRRSNQAGQLVAVIVLVQLPLSCWRALAKGQAEQVIRGVALLCHGVGNGHPLHPAWLVFKLVLPSARTGLF